MADKWVVDADHPQGHAVAMTAEEQQQFDRDKAEWAAQTATADTASQTAAAIAANLNGRMAKIRQARIALANGNLFAAMSANEKATIDGLLEDDLYLARLALHLYDAVA